MTAATGACLICDKHRGRGALTGPVIFEDDLVVVTHRPADGDGFATPGYLFVETRRHVRGLAELDEQEAARVARAAWHAARALESELEPEHVFSAIAGRRVSHFHQHVFVRPRGTPSSIPWNDVDSWPERSRIDRPALLALCDRLRTHFPITIG